MIDQLCWFVMDAYDLASPGIFECDPEGTILLKRRPKTVYSGAPEAFRGRKAG
jgi:hypothetical protein